MLLLPFYPLAGGGEPLYRRAGEVPSFHIAPARTGHARDLITGNLLGTYNSASPAWAVGPDGVLFQPAANAPVIEYDPTTRACLGARIWGAVTNLLLRSEDFTAAAWTAFRSTPSANTTTSPNGQVTADRLTEDSSVSNTHGIFQAATIANSTVYTFSVFVKPDGRTRIILGLDIGAGEKKTWFDLSSGTVGTNGNSAASITAYPNGWFRIAVTSTSASTTATVVIKLATADGVEVYNGNGVSSISLFGAQLQAGSTLGPYVPTTTLAASSTADVWSITGADFSRIWNQSAGTVYGDGNSTAGPFLAARATATSSNRIQFGPDNVQSAVIDGGAIQYISPTGAGKRAMAFAANDFAQQIQGQSINTDPSGTVPSVDYMTLGRYDFGGGEFLNGYIRELAIFRSRRPNSNLQAMTS